MSRLIALTALILSLSAPAFAQMANPVPADLWFPETPEPVVTRDLIQTGQ
ncbi:hypothetical protein [Litorisediminicola beolgyonensis]|uniref:Uncharacterized protein n=1 Tax=Litorisediminicola beolgyonensis TaxID=1173614 RepID=A0ABW3ZN68_9RHOB